MSQEPQRILIVGGGIIGLSTAFYLLHHPDLPPSTTVHLVEASEVAAGASGKAGGLLARDWQDGAPTEALARRSFDLHRQLALAYGGRQKWGYRALDTFSLAATAYSNVSPTATGKVPRSTEPHKTREQSAELLSWLRPEVVDRTEVIGDQQTTAQVHPRLFTLALRDICLSKGLVVHERTALLGLDTAPKSIKARLKPREGEAYDLAVDRICLCTGPWTGALVESVLGSKQARKCPIKGERAHSIVVRADLPPVALFTQIKLSKHEHAEPEIYNRPDGTSYICGPTDRCPLPAFASDVQVDEQAIRTLERQAAALSSSFSPDQTLTKQACFLPSSDTGTPIIGKLLDDIYVAAGQAAVY